MAETENPETMTNPEPEVNEASIQDMEVEPPADDQGADNGAAGLKRGREEEEEEGEQNGEDNEEAKKQKSDKSVEEERLEKTAEEEEEEKKSDTEPAPEPEPEPKLGPIDLGLKKFETSVEMFDYFYKFLHFWTPNINVNKVMKWW